ncbi:3612_t:CDS:1 [Ambispora gerdemannii]|uniref:3612_t:CDS:1 n=1 Tax=Ambispora gerdemannii TaxID=144530 RepID=A0A9N9CP34_9GLOM|nr:3612_t:CDS:1 [Ambispora gerdemannii]
MQHSMHFPQQTSSSMLSSHSSPQMSRQKRRISFAYIYSVSFLKMRQLSIDENLRDVVLISTWLQRHLNKRQETQRLHQQQEIEEQVRRLGLYEDNTDLYELSNNEMEEGEDEFDCRGIKIQK